ncbi:glycosyltransferase family 4 protein [Paenibacillus sp. YN15]|uniref:glycosyltransferase family 4 protein n=1 Tax=Paenibacillus sp. YN15 TaxID=1742774 RepID=UPI000DCBEFEE|nr:glycosyltransferase family 4 protein [Paenibacillus sp. YN15]RAV02058.1 glycosyltransferase family 4 protein [Paenibacillus sp. YN15]
MNIGLFTDTYYPQINGVATSVLMLKENLEKLGHTIYIFTTTDPEAPADERNVYRLPSIPFAGVRRLGLFYHPGIAREIRTLQLDLIHTHTEFSLGIFGRTIANELGIPTVHTMHTIYEHFTHYIAKIGTLDSAAKTLARKLSRHVCNTADTVIAPTEKVEEMLRVYGVRNRIAVIPTGIELGKFATARYGTDEVTALRAEYGLADTDKVLLYIGRVSQEKNIAEVLHGLKEYLPRHPNVKFLLVGDGPDRKNLQSLTQSLGIGSQVIFAGEKPWDQIGLYYQLGDVFVSASQSETQGLTFIEALAAGLPLIAKTDPCLDHVLSEGVNGFAFADQAGFLSALEVALSSDTLLQGMSTAAVRSTVPFSAETFARRAAALYEETLLQKNSYAFAFGKEEAHCLQPICEHQRTV